MAKETTVKPISLKYGKVGDTPNTPLMGVLKGFVINQDTPDEQEISAEFYDTAFDIIRTGKPVVFEFELANYELSELTPLVGGEVDASGDYEAPVSVQTTEHSWEVAFQRGYAAVYIYKGLTAGTIKKDADGALNFSMKITSTVYNDGTKSHIYKIKHRAAAATGGGD